MLNSYHPKLWALPKIHSYSIQEKPFLHIDGDIFIWKAFDQELMSSGLITQNKESATSFYENIMQLLEANLTYFPKEIEQERQKGELIYAYNAGIFGGHDINFFQRYTQKAFGFVNANLQNLDRINIVDFNIFFEQYLFYCMAKDEQKSVDVLFDNLIDDTQYTGFGDFREVPYNKKYLHLLGNYKKSTSVCTQMANRLRKDYPEHYYKIIELFRKKELPLFKNYYWFVGQCTKDEFISRHSALQNKYLNQMLVKETVMAEEVRCPDSWLFVHNGACNVDDEMQIEDHRNYLQKLSEIITHKFALISREYLYARDISCTMYFEHVFGTNSSVYEKIIVRDEIIEIIQSRYHWAFTEQYLLDDEIDQRNQPGIAYTAVVPECDELGYSLTRIDELDVLILETLSTPLSIGQLLEEVKTAFDIEDLSESLPEYEALIMGRVKNGLQQKTIKCTIKE